MVARRFASTESLYGTSQDSTSTGTRSLNHIDGIQSLSSKYDTFLLDMWGVMHNGIEPYEGVLDAVKQLKKENKKMIILSNSSKRISNSKKMLKKLGFDEDDFDQIITSGEVSHRMLCGDETLQCSNWDLLSDLIKNDKKKAFVFGSGDGDEDYIKESGWALASIDEADLIVARGTFTINNGNGSLVSKKVDEDEYFRVLNQSLEIAAERNLPMLVTNPDKVRPDKGLPPMPGAIGDSYEGVLGEGLNGLVKRIGKPYPEVYELALLGGEDAPTVMVGDALETDVTGGSWSKCSTAWIVNDGIHSFAVKEAGDFETGSEKVVNDFNDKKGYDGDDRLSPTYVSKHFRW
jgi:HAD superfamily hydrolase (TIGR01450 family)